VPPQITCASALPVETWKHENCIFHSNVLLEHCLNSTSCLISSIFLTQESRVWLPKPCNQCVQLGAVRGMVRDKRSPERCRSWTVLHAQCTSALPFGFPISQGNAEALDRWDGKIKHRLISRKVFRRLINTSAENYRNRFVCVKIIASQRWDVFGDTV